MRRRLKGGSWSRHRRDRSSERSSDRLPPQRQSTSPAAAIQAQRHRHRKKKRHRHPFFLVAIDNASTNLCLRSRVRGAWVDYCCCCCCCCRSGTYEDGDVRCARPVKRRTKQPADDGYGYRHDDDDDDDGDDDHDHCCCCCCDLTHTHTHSHPCASLNARAGQPSSHPAIQPSIHSSIHPATLTVQSNPIQSISQSWRRRCRRRRRQDSICRRWIDGSIDPSIHRSTDGCIAFPAALLTPRLIGCPLTHALSLISLPLFFSFSSLFLFVRCSITGGGHQIRLAAAAAAAAACALSNRALWSAQLPLPPCGGPGIPTP